MDQCSCDPVGCTLGEGSCVSKIMLMGQDGCDDQCNGCKGGEKNDDPEPEPEPEPEPDLVEQDWSCRIK